MKSQHTYILVLELIDANILWKMRSVSKSLNDIILDILSFRKSKRLVIKIDCYQSFTRLYSKIIPTYSKNVKSIFHESLNTMKWLRSEGCPWDRDTFYCATLNGNLENMKWLRSEGCPLVKGNFHFAAENGNLENMKWLRSEGCPWNEDTFCYAALNGNLENMKWLRSEGLSLIHI